MNTKQITYNAIHLLKSQRFSYASFCNMHGLNKANFSDKKCKGELSLKTIKLIYETFELEFNLVKDLKTYVSIVMSETKVKDIKAKLGISYNRAIYFVKSGKGSAKLLTDLYYANKEARDIIEPYIKCSYL
jgi:hypothetical protein